MAAQPTAPALRYVNAFLQDDAHVVALYRDEAGALKRRVLPAEWVAYYRQADLSAEMLRMLRGTSYVRSIVPQGEWLRVGYADRNSRRAMVEEERSPLRQAGVTSFEGDVHPVARWAADEALQIAKPRRALVDIETDSRCSFADAVEGFTRILIVTVMSMEDGSWWQGVLEAEDDEAERRLLLEMWERLKPFDQVVSWNGDGFDFPVIWGRSRRLRLGVNSNQWLWADHMEVFKKLNLAVAESGEEKRSMSLDSISKAVCGKGKLVPPDWALDVTKGRSLGAAMYDLWKAGGRYLQLAREYNVDDVERMRAIELKRPYLALFDTVCEACSVFGNTRGLNPTVEMDGFMLKLGMQRGHHFATKEFREGAQKRKGAYVMAPRLHGIGRSIHVADFKSLYPSIILSLNMSPDTKRTDVPCNGPIPPGVARCPTGTAFSQGKDGILVEAERECLRLRDHYKKLVGSFPANSPEWHDAKRKSNAYKLLGNSFYGVLLSPYSRFYDPDIGEAITQTGAWLIKKSIEAVEQYGLAYGGGWRVVYADTDGMYVEGPSEEEFLAFTKWANAELYPRLLKEIGCRETHHIRTAYEKAYDRLVFAMKRGGDEMASKTYCGSFIHYDGLRVAPDSEPEIKGLAYVRGDATRLAVALQAEMIDMLVGGMKVVADRSSVPTSDVNRFRELLERHKARVLSGPLAVEEVQKSQALDKPLREYVVRKKADGGESVPAHVRVGNILKERGREVREGTRIEYVVTDGSTSPMTVIPAEDYTGAEADRFYLWENLVYPPTRALLEVAFPPADERGIPDPEHDWSRWAKVRPKRDRRVLEGQLAFDVGLACTDPVTPLLRAVGLLEEPKSDKRLSLPEEQEPPEQRELHVVFVSGDDAAMLDLEQALAARPGDDPLEVVAWEAGPDGRFEIGHFRRYVDFDAIVGDHHLRDMLRRLGAHFAA